MRLLPLSNILFVIVLTRICSMFACVVHFRKCEFNINGPTPPLQAAARLLVSLSRQLPPIHELFSPLASAADEAKAVALLRNIAKLMLAEYPTSICVCFTCFPLSVLLFVVAIPV